MSITRGRTEPCKNTLSGVKNVYLWKWQPYSLAQIKGVRGVNLIEYPQTTIFKYPTLSDANTYEETLGDDNAYDQSLSVTLKKIDLESNQDLSKYHNLILGAVIEDYNGLFRLMGAFNGVDLSDLNVNVGSGRADFNGYKLTLESKERFKAPLFSNLNEIGLYVGGSNAPFIIEVNTANAGTPSNQFQFTGASGDYDVIAKQSGNIVQTFNNLSNDDTLTFANGSGVYILEVTPKAVSGFNRIRFSKSGDKLKIIDIKRWGGVVWNTFFQSFEGCTNLVISSVDVPNLQSVTSIQSMFKELPIANPETGNWDVSNVTSMATLFANTIIANPDVSNWDVSSVTSLSFAFFDTIAANPNVFLWNVGNVKSMGGMFFRAIAANPKVQNWNVSSVTNMSSMFKQAPLANPDVFNWNVSSVTNMKEMFFQATAANPDTTNWNVSNVINMSQMFESISTAANPNVFLWNVSSSTNMSRMFQNATAANPNMRNWDVSNVTNMGDMLNGANLSTDNLDGCYTNWSQLSLQQNVAFHAGTTQFTNAAQAGRDILVNTYNWTITDGGLV